MFKRELRLRRVMVVMCHLDKVQPDGRFRAVAG